MLKSIVRSIFWRYGYKTEKLVPTENIREMQRRFRNALVSVDLERIGNDGDGGIFST